jgi:hypothetical protein
MVVFADIRKFRYAGRTIELTGGYRTTGVWDGW